MCETCILTDTQTHAGRRAGRRAGRQAGAPQSVHDHSVKDGACSTTYGQKGDGLGHSHSHSAVPKHVPPQTLHTAQTPAEEHAQGQRKYTQCTVAHRCSCSPQERGSVPTNHSHVLGEDWEDYTFPVTHRFPLRPFQALRTNEMTNTLVEFSFSLVLFSFTVLQHRRQPGWSATPY